MSDEAVRRAVRGQCPRCGAGRLFASLAGFAPRCTACGLEFTRFNVGDGPAAFLTLLIGAVTTGLAMWLELGVGPPWWVHALIWPPVVIAGTVVALRLAKAVLLALECRHEAAEGRIDEDR